MKYLSKLCRWSSWSPYVCILGAAYFFVASTFYRFTHLEQTETELFLNLLDALLWKQ